MSNVNVSKEMIDIRDGQMICVILSGEDVLHIIGVVYLHYLFFLL